MTYPGLAWVSSLVSKTERAGFDSLTGCPLRYGLINDMKKLLRWWAVHSRYVSPIYWTIYFKNRYHNKKHMEQFTPNETFVSGCGSNAMLVTDKTNTILIGTDLQTGREVHIDAVSCLSEILEPSFAFTIGYLGDTFNQAIDSVYALVGESIDEHGHPNFYDMTPQRIMKEMETIRYNRSVDSGDLR